jgi:hypothetical protein
VALVFVNQVVIAAQEDSIYRLPAGTRIKLKLDVELGSGSASVDDTFLASVARPVLNREVIVVPAGTVVEGRVTHVRRAGMAGSGGQLDLRFESLRFARDANLPIEAKLAHKLESHSPNRGSVLRIVGGALVGTLIGAASRSSSGALLGAGIGGGAGTGVALLRRGKDVKIGRNEEFEIVLVKDAVLPVMAH